MEVGPLERPVIQTKLNIEHVFELLPGPGRYQERLSSEMLRHFAASPRRKNHGDVPSDSSRILFRVGFSAYPVVATEKKMLSNLLI